MTAHGGPVLGLLDSLTLPETITIAVIALMVLGPEKLPGMARTMGEWMQKLRRLTANLQAEVRDVMDDPAMQPIRDLGEFAAQPRRKLSEFALAAEQEAQLEAAAESQLEAAAESQLDAAPVEPDAEESGKIVAAGLDHPMEQLSPPRPATSTEP